MHSPLLFSWTNRTFIQLGVLVFVILFGTSVWILHIIKNSVRENVRLQLQTIQNATHEAMHYWRDSNIEAAIGIANRNSIRQHIARLINSKSNSVSLQKNPALISLQKKLKSFIKQHSYKGFFVVPRNQINYASMQANNLGQKNILLTKDSQSLLRAFAGETVISKPVKSNVHLTDNKGRLQTNQYSIFVITPITNEGGKIIALLMFQIDIAENFEKIFRLGQFGKSGESYVINKDGMLLSPSRFEIALMQTGLIIPDTSSAYQLILRKPAGDITRGYRPDKHYTDRPLTNTVKNILHKGYQNDVEPVRDYRGVKVLSIGEWDAHESLGFISQIDYQEAFGVYHTIRNAILIVSTVAALLLISLITSLINSRQTAQRLVQKRTLQLKLQNQSLSTEIEDRKKIEQALQNNQQRTNAILYSAFDAIIATDERGNIEIINPSAEDMFGYNKNELIGKNIKELMPEQVSKQHDQLMRQHEQDKISTIVGRRREMVAKRKNGKTFPIELAVEKTIIAGKKYFTATISDVSKHKAMIERLSASENEYKTIINNLSETFFRTDNKGNLIMASPSIEQLLGYRLDELMGLKLSALYIDPQSRKKFLHALKKNNGTITGYEAQLQHKDGQVIWVSTNAHFYTDEYDMTLGIEGTTRNITAHKLAEEEIRESRQRLSFHIRQTPLGVIEWDTNFQVIEWNPAAEQIFGYSRNEAIGRHAIDMIIPEEFKPHVDDVWHRLLGQNDGQNSTNQNITKQGETIWCEWHNTPLVDENMHVIGVASMVMDVTARKHATDVLARDHEQLQKLVDERTAEVNSARIEAERANESKSEFLANMSHELRTPIHTILSFAEIGMKKSDKLNKEKLRRYFTNIHQGGERQLLLLNDLLDLSKLEAGTTSYDLTENDISHVIDEQIAQHELMLKNKGLKIKIKTAPLDTMLEFDRLRIEQVIRNLLSNAIKFSEKNTTIIIKLVLGEIRSQHNSIPALTVIVSDEGIGIPEEELKSIFDKFVQSSKTRTGAGGTGLGLAICQEIIIAHGGEMWAENNKSGGASFCFTLPILHVEKTVSKSKSN